MTIEDIPEGYVHKATSDSFNGSESVSIWYSSVEDDYLILVESPTTEMVDFYTTKEQLKLLVQSATDVLDME